MSTPDPIEPEPRDEAVAADELPAAVVPATDEAPAVEPDLSDDATEVAEAADDPAPDPVLERLDDLAAQVAESHRLIARQTEVAASLHAENQELRGGELRQAQQSLVFGVLRVYDDVRRMATMTEDDAGRRDLELVADALADALDRNGVEATQIEPQAAFDPRRHKIARVAPHPDAEADRTIAEVVRPGFAWSDGDVIRAAEVVVFKHTPAAAPEPEPAPAVAPDPA